MCGYAEAQAPMLRRYTETRYGGQVLGLRTTRGSTEWLYDTLYCARGQAENPIKLHKTQLASDRTRCRSPSRYAWYCTPLPIGCC
jgi:hypothetical protein